MQLDGRRRLGLVMLECRGTRHHRRSDPHRPAATSAAGQAPRNGRRPALHQGTASRVLQAAGPRSLVGGWTTVFDFRRRVISRSCEGRRARCPRLPYTALHLDIRYGASARGAPNNPGSLRTTHPSRFDRATRRFRIDLNARPHPGSRNCQPAPRQSQATTGLSSRKVAAFSETGQSRRPSTIGGSSSSLQSPVTASR